MWIVNFNPRSHEGSDPTSSGPDSRAMKFQSSLPRGERQKETGSRAINVIFQSTLPRGERRLHCHSVSRNPQISIHAPTRGATMTYMFQCSLGLFQSTLPRGERPSSISLRRSIGTFQSTLPRGERRVLSVQLFDGFQFQSTLPRGERLHPVIVVSFACSISIHAPTRGAT